MSCTDQFNEPILLDWICTATGYSNEEELVISNPVKNNELLPLDIFILERRDTEYRLLELSFLTSFIEWSTVKYKMINQKDKKDRRVTRKC
jgi:hypothetical protein